MAHRWNQRQDMPPGRGRRDWPPEAASSGWRGPDDRETRGRYEARFADDYEMQDRYDNRRRDRMDHDDYRDHDRDDYGRSERRAQNRRDWDPANYGDLDRERGPGMSGAGSGRYGSRSGGRSDYAFRSDSDFETAPYGSGQREAGPHRGKGPKGYTRSDDRIRDDVCDRLSDDDRLDASEIGVEVSGGEVTLDGFVDTRMARRHAEDCVEACSGVGHIQNNLRVRDAAAQQTGAQTGTGGRSRSKDS